MGAVTDFAKDTVGAITGSTAADAAKRGGKKISKAAKRGRQDLRTAEGQQLAALRSGAGQAQRFLQPFTQAGQGQLGQLAEGFDTVQGDISGIRGLVTDPSQQASFIQNNPFFEALAGDAQRRIFGSQAAKGKLGAGGTAEALQNSLLLLGSDLLGQNIQQRQGVVQSGLNLNTQRQNLASLGAGSAANQANIASNLGSNQANVIGSTAGNIADLRLQGAGAQAAGGIGAAQARTQGIGNLIGLGSLGVGAVGAGFNPFGSNPQSEFIPKSMVS